MQPIARDWVAWSVCLSVCNDREPCKNGWTDRDAILVVDSGGPKEPCIRCGPDLHIWRGNFDGEKAPAQNMPGYVRRSIYSKWLSRGQHRYSADAYWRALDGVHIGATWRIQLNWRYAAVMQPYVKSLWPLVMVALFNRADHYIFMLWFVLFFLA